MESSHSAKTPACKHDEWLMETCCCSVFCMKSMHPSIHLMYAFCLPVITEGTRGKKPKVLSAHLAVLTREHRTVSDCEKSSCLTLVSVISWKCKRNHLSVETYF